MSKTKKADKVEMTATAIKAAKLQAGNKNPYIDPYRVGGKYSLGFAALRAFKTKSGKALAFTKAELTEACAKVGLTASGVGVLMSPSKSSERGDCRGNKSAAGHVYFVDRLAKKAGEDKKYIFGWRPVILEALSRDTVLAGVSVEAETVEVEVEDAAPVDAVEIPETETAETAETADTVEVDETSDAVDA